MARRRVLVLRHDQDQPSTRREIRQGRGGDEGEKEREKLGKERDRRRCNLHRCGTDVRTYERTKVGLSYDSVCSRGPALDPAKRIFFLFFISSSAAPPQEPSAMHHLRFTPVRPPLRHRCTTTPPSQPITIPPQPSSWLESSIPPTLAGRECSAEL